MLANLSPRSNHTRPAATEEPKRIIPRAEMALESSVLIARQGSRDVLTEKAQATRTCPVVISDGTDNEDESKEVDENKYLPNEMKISHECICHATDRYCADS